MFVGLDPQKTLQKLCVASIPEVKIVELTCDKLLLVKHIINHHIQTPLLHTSILRNVHYYLCIYILIIYVGSWSKYMKVTITFSDL
jgi:hypothetical protein